MSGSWQPYVDGNLIGTGKINRAAIIGLSGGVWASSEGYSVSTEEQKAIVASFLDPSSAQGSGVRSNSTKFMCLNANDRSVYGKSKSGGIITVKTAQAVLVAEYDNPAPAGDATKIVEDLADWLIERGF